MARILFILGAGASAQAGCPVMSDFIERARTLRHTSNDTEFARHFDVVHRFKEVLQRAYAKAKLDTENIESVFSALEMAIATGYLANTDASDLKQVRQSLLHVIARTLELTQRFTIKRVDHPERKFYFYGPAGYTDLCSLISELTHASRAERHQVGVISFNYDCGLDVAMKMSRIGPDYCLNGKATQDSALMIPLCKLHGSLNWYLTPKSDLTPLSPISFIDPLEGFNDNLKETKDGDGRLSLLSRLGQFKDEQSRSPFIVPPTDAKSEGRNAIAPVWRRAGQLLREAEHIYVMGYSIPESDQFFRTLFAICMTSDTIVRKVGVFDPSRAPFQRLSEMIGPAISSKQGVFKHYEKRFEDGVKELHNQFLRDNWIL